MLPSSASRWCPTCASRLATIVATPSKQLGRHDASAVTGVLVLIGLGGLTWADGHEVGRDLGLNRLAFDQSGRRLHGDFTLLLGVLRDEGSQGAVLQGCHLCGRRVIC